MARWIFEELSSHLTLTASSTRTTGGTVLIIFIPLLVFPYTLHISFHLRFKTSKYRSILTCLMIGILTHFLSKFSL